MPTTDRLIELNQRLLALYLQIASASLPKDDLFAIAELLAIRDQLSPQAEPKSAAAFDRYSRLIALQLDHGGRLRFAKALEDGSARADEPAHLTLPPAFNGQSGGLGSIRAEGHMGISVVTCCMNRNANLIKSLPSWLANAEISEVVIVDWSSAMPVEADLKLAGIADPRIRILRVEAEPRWVLSYAFNAGFRAAACNHILKVDADIVLSQDFFRRNHVVDGSFIAGNWRQAPSDQAHVNGFFYLSRQALHMVGGFNEHITTYGWDDDDIYDRLAQVGFRRRDVASGTIFHLPHRDEARTSDDDRGVKDTGTLRGDLASGTTYLIRRNRFIAAVMPYWDSNSIPLPFRMLTRHDAVMSVQREGWVPSKVPGHFQDAARTHALTELATWRLGRRTMELPPDRLGPVLDRPTNQVSLVDVEVAIAAPDQVIRGPGHYLVLDLTGGILDSYPLSPRLGAVFARLISTARRLDLTPVLRAPHVDLPAQTPECLRTIALIPSWELIGEVARISAEVLVTSSRPATANLLLALNIQDIERLCLATPDHILPRKRLYIDAQHGLGNRLRAIGSAAAIAAASDREFVIVWQPDEHCNGLFSDLFDYDGAVVETRFIETAEASGCDLYNYMPNESATSKDQPIRVQSGRDIYARSAFVLNNPHSTWASENYFLQSLTPIAAIRDLVTSVRHPNDLSAHVRMEGGTKSEHLPYEKADNWLPEDHALIDEWRSKSHFSHFLLRIDTLIADGRAERIFLAADMAETYAEFQHHYGDRLAWLPRGLYDRSAEQLHYALADAILLSRSPLLLGSTWSSFSELAMRLAPGKIVIEMSGKDF